MDTAKTITHLGLCAGYGGIELGLKRVIPTLRSVALCEIESFAVANLVSKMEAGLMDPAPIWTDLKTFPWESFRDRVDILTGGYPCQPFSAAGKRLGGEDPRHLWPHISRGISILQPRVCFFENVEGHITCGLHHVLCDLGRLGYRTTWGLFSAAECGAPHQRKRVFILANRCDTRLQGTEWIREAGTERPPSGHTSQCNGSVAVASGLGGASGLSGPFPRYEGQSGESDNSGYKVMADTTMWRRDRQHAGCSGDVGEWSASEDVRPEATHAGSCRTAQAWPSRPGEQQYGWEPPRVVNSASARQQAQRSEPNRERGQGSTSESGQLADSHRIDRSAQTEGREHDRQVGSAGEELGDSQIGNGKGQQLHLRQGQGEHRGTSGSECSGRRQTQLPLGRNFNEPSDRMDYAELCISCDNRTDELRLLGNGVVPATASLAFRTLMNELCSPPSY